MSLEIVSTFSKRLKEAMGNISTTELADKIGMSKQAVSTYTTGIRTPKTPTIKAIAQLLNVSEVWLCGYNVEKHIAVPSNALPYVRGSKIPIIGTIRAGYGGIAYEEHNGFGFADVNNPEEYFFLRVMGDSMEPRIFDGNLALVHKQPDVESGELAAVIINGEEGTVKKIIKHGDSLVLQAFNANYPPRIISGPELNEVVIVGKVIETKTKW